MLSVNTMTNLSSSSVNMKFIRYMKHAVALVSPNDIIKYLYNPYLVDVDGHKTPYSTTNMY
jgi:hypothetical protein